MPKVVELTKIKYDLTRNFTSANGHAYTAGNLILWTRADDSSRFDDQGSGGHTITTSRAMHRPNSGPLIDTNLNNLRSTIQFSTFAGAIIQDAADLSFGDGSSSDTSFSMSLWIKLVDLSSTTYLIQKYGASGYEYHVYYSGGSLVARLYKNNSSTQFLGFSASASLVANEWAHIVFTYTASGTTTNRGSFYLNGSALSTTGADANSYTFMKPGSSNLNVAPTQQRKTTHKINRLLFTSLLSGRVEFCRLRTSQPFMM